MKLLDWLVKIATVPFGDALVLSVGADSPKPVWNILLLQRETIIKVDIITGKILYILWMIVHPK